MSGRHKYHGDGRVPRATSKIVRGVSNVPTLARLEELLRTDRERSQTPQEDDPMNTITDRREALLERAAALRWPAVTVAGQLAATEGAWRALMAHENQPANVAAQLAQLEARAAEIRSASPDPSVLAYREKRARVFARDVERAHAHAVAAQEEAARRMLPELLQRLDDGLGDEERA